jgi:hypothetical protein
MSQKRLRGGIAGLATFTVFLLVLLLIRPPQESASGPPAGQKPRKPRPEGKPVAMLSGLTGLTIRLGLMDEKASAWDGEIHLSEGKLIALTVAQGNVKGKIDGNQFSVRSVYKKKKDELIKPILHATVEAPVTAKVTVKTVQGAFSFTLAELAPGVVKTFLKGQASVEPETGAVRLTTSPTEDDYPALARAPDGTLWLAYSEYQQGSPLIAERALAGNFETLVTTGHGDQILLQRFDGKLWHPPLEVTEPGLDIWRPALVVDKKGIVTIAWAQQVNGNWDIYYRQYTPPGKDGGKGEWSKVVRLTDAAGSDFHVVATADGGTGGRPPVEGAARHLKELGQQLEPGHRGRLRRDRLRRLGHLRAGQLRRAPLRA